MNAKSWTCWKVKLCEQFMQEGHSSGIDVQQINVHQINVQQIDVQQMGSR